MLIFSVRTPDRDISTIYYRPDVGHWIRNTFLRRLVKTVVTLVVVLSALPLALYVAPVQKTLLTYALDKVNSSGDMKVSYESLRLYWPLHLEGHGIDVLTAPGDTMAHVGHIDIDVEALPLLAMRVCAHAAIDDVRYTMGHPDSAMWLDARADRFRLDPSTFHLASSRLDISTAELDGARVHLTINPSDSTTATDTGTSQGGMSINAGTLILRDIDFSMIMRPTIDSIGAHIDIATLRSGDIDLGRQTVYARSLSVDSVTAMYLIPPTDTVTVTTSVPADTVTPSIPWTISADHLTLSAREAVYGVRGHEPRPGLDMEWLQVADVDIAIDSFYNRATDITVPVRRLIATERCGLHVDATGTFSMDSTAMRADSIQIATYFSTITLNAIMGLGNMGTDPSLPLQLKTDARVGFKDIALAMPSLEPLLSQLPRYRDLVATADINGTIGDLDIADMSIKLPDYFHLVANGHVAGLPSTDDINGNVRLSGQINDTPLLRSKIVRETLGPSVTLPPLTLSGDMSMRSGTLDGRLKAATDSGTLALDARWNGRLPQYRLHLTTTDFPVNTFLPTSGLGRLSAVADIDGRGIDPSSPRTSATASMALQSLRYNNRLLRDINLRARLDSCRLTADIGSTNADADLNLTLAGRIDSTTWHTTLGGNVRGIDLQALGLSTTPMSGSLGIDGNMTFDPGRQYYNGRIDISRLNWLIGDTRLATRLISLVVDANNTTVGLSLDNGDFNARLAVNGGITDIMARLDTTIAVLDRGLAARHISFDSIQRVMPRFNLQVNSGQNSLAGDMLQQADIDIRHIRLDMANDTTLHALAWANGLHIDRQRIDSVALVMTQRADTMALDGGMYNRRGTFDKFATVTATGTMQPNTLTLLLDQRDIDGHTGYKLGFNIAAVDSVLNFRLLPDNPVINYKTWALNSDNYIVYNGKTGLIDADLRLSDGPSYLQILTHRHPTDSLGMQSEDLQIIASQIHLADWIAVSPFAPPIKGDLATDIHLSYSPDDKTLSGRGTVQVADLTYGKSRVGTFDLGLDLSTNTRKVVQAALSLAVDSTHVLTARGALNDSTATSPMMLGVSLDRFPLRLANPFLPQGVATLDGTLSGDMTATGTITSPRLDGYIHFDSAAVTADMLGTRFTFAPTPIRVDSNIVHFDSFSIKGANDNPLSVDGTVDINTLSQPAIDIRLAAANMQVLKSERRRGQEAYGKAFIDLDATVRGDMRLLTVNASLSLLSGSNLTYVLGGSTTDLPSLAGSTDAVRFVQFSDSTAVADADTIAGSSMALMLNARLNINDGTTINVDLSAGNAQDRAQLVGNGALTFTMSPFADMRLTGRYNINSGYVRYSPPLMSQKNFEFERGSYVAFNGDMLNPTLNIHAVDQIRANVTETGQNSRLVNFDVTLSVTQTLDNMNVTFDLSTEDDITVKNELQAMSADQRANQAMNLLLYNVYTGPSTKGSANMSGNPLFSFLASTLNTWAANNIKGVELTFGVDQYDRTYNGSTSTATSYNYQVSKSFANDRIKVVVGGNYTDDDASTQDYRQSLINDISVEYMINRTGTMYVKLFRHTGFESILEGEVTQTGAGFVYRRKLGSLYSLLPRFMRPRRWRRIEKPLTPQQIIDNATQTLPANEKSE